MIQDVYAVIINDQTSSITSHSTHYTVRPSRKRAIAGNQLRGNYSDNLTRHMNNFIHHKSGSNEYKNKQTNITKLTPSVRVYQQKHNGQPCIRMCLQTELSTELYEAKNLVFHNLYSPITR